MNVEDELHRIFTDDRLDLPVRGNAGTSIVAGAKRLRRKRIALITAGGTAGVAIVAAGAVTIGGLIVTAPRNEHATVAIAAPADQPGDPTVRLDARAAANALHEDVRALLQRYFDAINRKDFASFVSVVSAKRAEGQTEEAWQRAYRSTRDGSILVRWIEAGPEQTARAEVTFTSVQALEDAPKDLAEPCISWTAVFPLKFENGAWKVDWAPPGSTKVKC